MIHENDIEFFLLGYFDTFHAALCFGYVKLCAFEQIDKHLTVHAVIINHKYLCVGCDKNRSVGSMAVILCGHIHFSERSCVHDFLPDSE